MTANPKNKEKRIGLFVCHCGVNIAGVVDVEKVARVLKDYPGVTFSTDYVYMCSDPGQQMIIDTIKEKHLDGIIIAACSPTLHEKTFQEAARLAGLNPYQIEIANIREQDSWVHTDKEKATKKAVKIVKAHVAKARQNENLDPIKVDVTRRALVIGGGVSGLQAALDIADHGYEVILVEKNPSIGGKMIQLSETFPTLDCSQCILTPKMVEVSRHPRIKLLTYHEVDSISGFVGNFKVRIKKKPRYVDETLCNLCGECEKVCPQVVPDEFNMGLSFRKAIYMPFPQAIPGTFSLDAEHCLGLNPVRCGKCKDVCEKKAIDYDMKETIVEEEVGAVVVATGYDLYTMQALGEYGGEKYEDVVNGLEFERILSASGPTGGTIRRPSDGKIPKSVVFVQCSGSRDTEKHLPYCSKICCMYTAKHAMMYRHRVPDGQATVFYIDVRTGGKSFDEFYMRTVEEDKVLYIRGKVSKIFKEGDKLIVWGVDTLTGKKVEVEADMVVLAMAMVKADGVQDLLKKLKIATDIHGFLAEAHPKLRPVESLNAGFYLAGCALGPKDIPETVAQASAAAAKVGDLFAQKELLHEPTVVPVNDELCSGCGICLTMCPYSARSLDPSRGVAVVNEILCEGCGACAAACPSGAAQQRNQTDNQIFSMLRAMLRE
ncbi:MAG TPA: CoB--CoM heterodisulfide reductase iron-sulfur subunit A family protein [Acidobacteriota bacterium]|nr:CoB--CoM heterodisulfide reductase iron-sulfur subunit A family protein [Acidobacteriota bacterium]